MEYINSCLRGDATPDPKLVFMFADVVEYIGSTHSAFVFFQIDTLETDMLISGAASGDRVFMYLQGWKA